MMDATVPIFSIVMPLYDKERDVLRAIDSVRAQTVVDWELVVVNDGSTDRGPELVRSIADPRIRLIDQENGGVSAARNRGIQEARAELIAFLDADDEWNPDFLETILGLRDRYPGCTVYATHYRIRKPDGDSYEARIHGLPCGFTEGELRNYFCVAACSDPPLWTSAVAVKRQTISGVGGFPIGIASGEDLLTWARIAVNSRIAYSTRTCATFYMSGIDRVPAEPDIVGTELAALDAAHPEIPYLHQYIALWHRMRMVMFLRRGDKDKSRIAFRQMARYSGRRTEYFACLAAAYSPRWLYRFGIAIRRLLARMIGAR